MIPDKKTQPRQEHPGWNLFVHTGLILKVLTGLALIALLWYLK